MRRFLLSACRLSSRYEWKPSSLREGFLRAQVWFTCHLLLHNNGFILLHRISNDPDSSGDNIRFLLLNCVALRAHLDEPVRCERDGGRLHCGKLLLAYFVTVALGIVLDAR